MNGERATYRVRHDRSRTASAPYRAPPIRSPLVLGGMSRDRLRATMPAVLGGVAVLAVVLALAVTWHGFAAVGTGIADAAWLLPGLAVLHLGQLFLAGTCWRLLFTGQMLFTGRVPGIGLFYRLRVIREGIDSLLPVAQVGGEVVGTRMLAGAGVPLPRAAASVIADVTVEVLSQLLFLLAGLGLLATRADGVAWRQWLAALLGGAVAVSILVALQRFGALRLLEGLLRGMAKRWPALAGTSLDGIHAEALAFQRNHRGLWASFGLHFFTWTLGSVETWAVLHALGVPVTPAEAFIIESLGMAGRSAGFAIPAALGAQESGFLLAAAAVGVGAAPALALSVVKRLREVLVGSIGLLLWRVAAHRGRGGHAMAPALEGSQGE